MAEQDDFFKTFDAKDPAFAAHTDQQLALVLDTIRNSDEYIVFTRKRGEAPICQGRYDMSNWEGWVGALYDQMMRMAQDEAYHG